MSVKKVLLVLIIASVSWHLQPRAEGLALGVNPSSSGRAWAWSGDVAPRLAPLLDRFSSEMQISPSASPEADRYKPAVAHNSNHNEYLVV